MASGNPPLDNPPNNLTTGLSNTNPGGFYDKNLCSAAFVGDILITEFSLPSDPSWPADLILDCGQKSNWREWSRRLNTMVDRQSFTDWLDGGIPYPDATTHARACEIWKINDRALRTFILNRVSIVDYNIVHELPDSHTIYKALRHRHQRLELHAQVLLIKEGLDSIRFKPGVPFTDTFNKIDKLHARFREMGSINEEGKLDNHLLTVCLLNAFEGHPRLHSAMDRALDKPFSSSCDVIAASDLKRNSSSFVQSEAYLTILLKPQPTRRWPSERRVKRRLGHFVQTANAATTARIFVSSWW